MIKSQYLATDRHFENDKFIEKEMIKLRDEFNISIVVETGTFWGQSAKFFVKILKRCILLDYMKKIVKQLKIFPNSKLVYDKYEDFQYTFENIEKYLDDIYDGEYEHYYNSDEESGGQGRCDLY